jgi:hypothetical protein
MIYLCNFTTISKCFDSFGLALTLQASKMAAQCLHWKKVASRFAMSQKPSADLQSGQTPRDLGSLSTFPRLNLSPEWLKTMVRFIYYVVSVLVH